MPTIAEHTPNPRTLRVLPGGPVSPAPVEFFRRDADGHPFLSDLFSIDGLESVLLGENFIAVTAAASGAWADPMTTKAVVACVERHSASYPAATRAVQDFRPDGRAAEIVAILDQRIRPAVAHDGGDVVMESFSNGVLTLRMRGACAGCPSAQATLKHGIMGVMRQFAPDVKEVRAA